MWQRDAMPANFGAATPSIHAERGPRDSVIAASPTAKAQLEFVTAKICWSLLTGMFAYGPVPVGVSASASSLRRYCPISSLQYAATLAASRARMTPMILLGLPDVFFPDTNPEVATLRH